MARRGYRIEWIILGAVLAVVVGLGVVFGPGLYKKGRGVVGPIVELARSDKEITVLNEEIPFEVPEDGVVSEDRLLAFLAIRRDLLATYEQWDELVERLEVEGKTEDSWQGATEVLEETRKVFRGQIDVLREGRMSPQEFKWLEETVYDTWWKGVSDRSQGETPDSILGRKDQLRSDIELLGSLVDRHGSSPLAEEMRQSLVDQLALLDEPSLADVNGVADDNEALFRQYWEEISSLRLNEHSLHSRLREEDVNVHIDNQGVKVEETRDPDDGN